MMRLYILVNSYLSAAQVAVQSVHATVALMCGENRFVFEEAPVIILDGGNQKSMEKSFNYLNSIEANFSYFEEPDANGMLTAIAFPVYDQSTHQNPGLQWFVKSFKLYR